jgi:hypothetical protein
MQYARPTATPGDTATPRRNSDLRRVIDDRRGASGNGSPSVRADASGAAGGAAAGFSAGFESILRFRGDDMALRNKYRANDRTVRVVIDPGGTNK